jgi:hypothetical protein
MQIAPGENLADLGIFIHFGDGHVVFVEVS